MHIWFLNQFYPPDRAPTGAMLEAVVERMSADGHRCVVWCSGGSYGTSDAAPPKSTIQNRPSGGAEVLRIGTLGAGKSFFSKLRGWLGFYLLLTLRLLLARERPDVIVAMTTPPFLSVLARVAAWRHRARHAHWVMDLYPDVMAAHGMLREESLPYRVLAGLARWGFGGKRAGAVLTIGPCMSERIGKHVTNHADHPKSNIQHPKLLPWVPLWAGSAERHDPTGLEAAGRQLRQERGWGPDELVILYSGNLGRGHLVQPALDCALKLAGEGRRVRWVFCAHGARLGEVRRFAEVHPDAGVEFLEPVPAALLDAHLASADVHLASLNESWTGCMVPSKLQGIFAVGRPVLFIGSAESSIGRWVNESGGGWVLRPGDAAGMLAALEQAHDPRLRQSRGVAARVFAETHFNKERNVARVAEILAGRPLDAGSGLTAGHDPYVTCGVTRK